MDVNTTALQKTERGMHNPVLGGTLFGINVCIVLLNALVLMVIMRFRTKNCIDILILGLALTDLTKGVVPVPMSVVIYLSSWYLKEGSIACQFFGWIAFTTNSASMLILTIMAIERFVAIIKPFAYRRLITKKRMKISVFVAVLFSATVSVLPVLGIGQMVPYNQGAYCHFDYSKNSTASRVYSIFILIYGLSMTIVVMIAYSVVFYKIRDLIKRHRRFSVAKILAKVSVTNGQQKKDINLKVERMFSYLTVGLMLLFWFSWLPFLVVVFTSQTSLQTPHEKVDLFAIRVAVVNAMLNPLACASLCRPYRRGFLYYYKKLLSFAGFARPDSDVFDPWKHRSQQVNRDPTPWNSLTNQNEARFDSSSPITDIYSHTDSGFVSDSLPRYGRIPSTLEPLQNAMYKDESNMMLEGDRAALRLHPVEERSHHASSELDNIACTSFSIEGDITIDSQPEDTINSSNIPENGSSNENEKREDCLSTNLVLTEPRTVLSKRYSTPVFQSGTHQDRQSKPKTSGVPSRKYCKYWRSSTDLPRMLHGYEHPLKGEIRLTCSRDSHTNRGNDVTGSSVHEYESKESGGDCVDLQIKNEKHQVGKVEMFSNFGRRNEKKLKVLHMLKQEFSEESSQNQDRKARSSSTPSRYGHELKSEVKFQSLQRHLQESLLQIDSLTKDLLVLSGSYQSTVSDGDDDVFI